MIVYDKTEIRNQLTQTQIYELLDFFGGEPEVTSFGLISRTICHNAPEDNPSRKLYWYSNTDLFRCYSGCEEPVFDIFQLVSKAMQIQEHKDFDLNDSVRWVAQRFNIAGRQEANEAIDPLEDWKYLENYKRIQEIEPSNSRITLKEYDPTILDRFNYSIKIGPWLQEGISQEAIEQARIGFYPGADQITIPHYDKDNRFIGLRGRTLSVEEGQRYGKYRPIRANGILFNHPLGMNLYNLNNAKEAITRTRAAIVYEGEKSCLHHATFFGCENNNSVACCGSNLTRYQVDLLLDLGVREIIVAFDKQFKENSTDESRLWARKMERMYNSYKSKVLISFMYDKFNLLSYKASPCDEGKDKFLYLFKNRIIL